MSIFFAGQKYAAQLTIVVLIALLSCDNIVFCPQLVASRNDLIHGNITRVVCIEKVALRFLLKRYLHPPDLVADVHKSTMALDLYIYSPAVVIVSSEARCLEDGRV